MRFSLKQFVDEVQPERALSGRSKKHNLGLRQRQAGSDRMLYRLMMQALSKRKQARNSPLADNLYLREDAIPQIKLFDIMASQFPLISKSRQIANAMLNNMLPSGEECVTLFSIGIGSAQQEADFLRLLANRSEPCRQIQVVGLEPSEASINVARQRLTETAEALGLNFHFIPILRPIEALDDSDWALIARQPGKLLINEAFALHHTGLDAEGNELRDGVLRQLKALEPHGFVLIEPNSDHVTSDWEQRFENCWSHFSLVFQVIDEMETDTQVKDAIKQLFFGREIENIMALDEASRHERHETVAQWQNRLSMAGFEPACSVFPIEASGPEITTVQNYDTYIGLNVVEQTVVAIIGVK